MWEAGAEGKAGCVPRLCGDTGRGLLGALVGGQRGGGTTQESEAWASRGLAVPDSVDCLRSSPSPRRPPLSSSSRLASSGSATPAPRGRGWEGPGRRSQRRPRHRAPADLGLERRFRRAQVGTRVGNKQGTEGPGGRGRAGTRMLGGDPLRCPRQPRGPLSPQLGVRGSLVPAPRPPAFPPALPSPCVQLLSSRSASSETAPQRPPGFASPSPSLAPCSSHRFLPKASRSLCVAAWGEVGVRYKEPEGESSVVGAVAGGPVPFSCILVSPVLQRRGAGPMFSE